MNLNHPGQDFEVPCPACGQTLKIRLENSLEPISCPACKKTVLDPSVQFS